MMAPIRCGSNNCTARAFVQLAKRRYGTTPASSVSFDFLVPRNTNTAPAFHSSTPRISLSNFDSRITSFSKTSRCFSTSPARQATVCVRNPQQDEDGNDMMLEITPRAAKRLSQIMTKDKNPNLALRIQVESGGCHGFQYVMSLITIPSEGAEDTSTIKEDDSIFQFVADEGSAEATAESSPKIILDEPSLDLLKGSKVDFTQELIGSQFKIIDNPLATSSCGCGTSFDIKM